MLKKLASKFRALTSRSNPKPPDSFASEEDYYEYLFTQSGYYSSATPNSEERLRWSHIQSLVEKAIGLQNGNKPQLIVDFGCGRGWLSNELSHFGKIIGIEPVASVVKYGKKMYPELDLRNGSIEMLAGLKADMIVSSEVIEHISEAEQPKYFTAFRQALNDGGFLIITTPRKEAFEEWTKFLDPSQPVEEWLTEEQVKGFAAAAGFSVIFKITYSMAPAEGAQPIEIYQQWLFRAP